MDPEAVHLKDIDQQEVKFIEEVVDTKTGAEGTVIIVLVYFPLIWDIAVLDSLLYNLDTTEEIASVCGHKAVQEKLDLWLAGSKERKKLQVG